MSQHDTCYNTDDDLTSCCIGEINGFIKQYGTSKNELCLSAIKHSMSMIISGSTGTGKTYYIKDLLVENLIQPPPAMWSYSMGLCNRCMNPS